jgi:hypothetical protein
MNWMPTYQLLWDYLGRRPFEPFRLTLRSGESLDVTRIAQAAMSRQRVVYVTPDDHLRWVPLDQIAGLESLAAAAA